MKSFNLSIEHFEQQSVEKETNLDPVVPQNQHQNLNTTQGNMLNPLFMKSTSYAQMNINPKLDSLLQNQHQNLNKTQGDKIDPRIMKSTSYAELDNKQKYLVNKFKSNYSFSYEHLKSIIPDAKAYDQLDMERNNHIKMLIKEAPTNEEKVIRNLRSVNRTETRLKKNPKQHLT